MVKMVKERKIEAVSKNDLINRLSLIDDIIRVGYNFAAKYVLEDVEEFYKEIKGQDYETIQKNIIAQLYQAR